MSIALFLSPFRSARLHVSLAGFALAALLLPGSAGAQQTFTGGGAVSLSSSQLTASSSTLTIGGATGSSIATLKVILNGVTSDGNAGNFFSLQPTSFLLQAPNGGPSLVLLGETGDGTDGDDGQDSGSGLSNVTITIQDGASAAPDGNPSIWPHTGSITVKPSSYFDADGQTPPQGTPASYPQSDGSATLTSRFAGAGINNGDKWTLSIINCCSVPTPVSVSSWEMVVTYATTSPTSTAVSSSANPGFTGNSITLTATVSGSGTPTGTVAFSDNGTTISGCGAEVVSGGQAHCPTSMAQGYHAVNASYTPANGNGFGPSSGSLTELIEVHPAQSGNTWCNNTSFSSILNGTSIAYPAMIPVSGYPAGSTVGNVTLELEGVSQGAPGTGIDGEFLLVAPGGGNNLDFLDTAFNTQGSNVNLYISDAATLSPNYGTAVSNDTYLPFDGNTQTIDSFPASNSPIVDSNIPLVPGTINYAAPHGHTNSFTLQQAFSGAPANGDWALYATASNGTDALTVGGWCVTLDVNSGVGTTTSLSSSKQDAFTGTNVTLTATVVVNGTSTPVTSGTVEFKDETTGTVLASANSLNGSGVAAVTISNLAEGDHKILASYSGTSSFNTSFGTIYQRIDDATAVTGTSPTWQFCNTGKITIPMGSSGAETPNPSNIFVSNLPGTLKTATLTLENFSILVGDELDNTESLVVGPTGTALDFFSNTAGGTIEDEANAGNYTFADSASSLVPSGSGNINPGTYKPTSYVGTDNANDVFTADPGGFFTLPGFGYSASRGTSTFASEFGSANPNGTWSLYFNSPNANANGTGAAGGWCLNLSENLPSIATPVLASVGSFAQGEANAQFTVSGITDNGPGPTGDPSVGSNPMKVTDALPTGLTPGTLPTGTPWNCTSSGQTVSCTDDSPVASGSAYPELTIDVNVGPTATGILSNTVTAGGAGAGTQTSNTVNVTIDVPPSITSGSSTTFTTGIAGSFVVTTSASSYPTPSLSENGPLPGGVTFTDLGNGAATLSGTPAAGSGGNYSIVITANNGATAAQNFILFVDQPPSVTSANGTNFAFGVPGSFTVTTSGYPTSALSQNGALPTGVNFTDNGNGTATLAGTPTSAGTFPITITANNGVLPSASQSFTLAVSLPQFQLTTAANPAAGGMVTPTTGNLYTQGTSVPLTATPAVGYTFVNWSSTGDPVASSTSASTSITVNEADSVTANFAPSLVVTVASDLTSNAGDCTPQTTPGTGTDTACSLRDALLYANNAGMANITFDSTVFSSSQSLAARTITLSLGSLPLPTYTTITGATSGSGATLTNLVTVDGGGPSNNFPVFTVNASAVGASIANLAIKDGNYNGGTAAGIVNGYQAVLNVTNSTISGNVAPSGTGGIFNDYNATLNVTGSTISGNSGGDGGIVNESGGIVTVTDSTISGNTGGGIVSGGAALTVTASTISANTAVFDGGGIVNTAGTLTLNNTIVSLNSAPTNPDVDGTVSGTGNQIGVAGIGLAPLANYGGPTQTQLPLPGSPAICGGLSANVSSLSGDQRGVAFGYPLCPANTVDAGAVQTNYALSFSTEPPVSLASNQAMTPAPVVALTENSLVATAVTSPVVMTDSAGLLGGTTTANLTAGSATFSDLTLSLNTASDTLTATLALNASVSLTAASSAIQVPPVSLSVSSFDYGAQVVGTPSPSHAALLTNNTATTLTISSITVTGADPTSFVFGNIDYPTPASCGATLAAGASCRVHGHFQPTASGPMTASVTITDSASGSPQSIGLSGFGVELNSTTVSFTASNLSFGDQQVGTTSASQQVTFSNTGSVPLSILSLGVTGANASSFFFLSNCGASLAAGASCSIHGHFTPTAVGPLTAAISITDSASASPQTVTLSGNGTLPAASLSSSSITFTGLEIGTTSASQQVILTNTGGARLIFTSISVTGPDASSFLFLNNCGTSLAPGASCTIHGHFTPTGAGTLTAAVTIADNASDSPQSVTLTGTGDTPPAVSLSSPSVSFNPQTVGTTSASQSVTLTNTGGTRLFITSVTVTGTDANSFLFLSDCGTSVAAGASCSIHGHFTPTATGPLTAAVTITDNASDSPQSIVLNGTGQ